MFAINAKMLFSAFRRNAHAAAPIARRVHVPATTEEKRSAAERELRRHPATIAFEDRLYQARELHIPFGKRLHEFLSSAVEGAEAARRQIAAKYGFQPAELRA
jgi:hypothetical protein